MIEVSVIIPCRNEEKFIGKCLESIINQDFPKERMEILVVDGMSEDKTREIVENFKFQNANLKIKLLENSKRFTPFALNIGIKEAKGEFIIRMDAHATYEKDYISKCIHYLKEYNADCVGGILKTLPMTNTLEAKAIAISLSHPFGAGTSWFRVGTKKPKEVDTVFGGCYKKEVFQKVSLFNEKLIRSQDIEFNKRLKKAGGKILLFPDIVAYYYPKSTFSEFFKHNFLDGIWTFFPLKFKIKIFSIRHLVPLFFVLTLPLSIWPYILISLFFSAQIVFREKNAKLLFLMPIAFFCRHFGYGLGSIFGFIKML
jgi:glycosyltransferase involved in cell wall biosynthesis